jgi:cholera toxin transcriptional activator
MTSASNPARYRFGAFEADAATGELRRGGIRVRVHVQPSQVLLLLLEKPGVVLTRDEIARELWPDGTFVDFDHGVNSAVNRIREALGDKAKSPRYIETLARRGYRFVAPVERLAQVSAEDVPLILQSEKAPLPSFAEPRTAVPVTLLASVKDLPAIPTATASLLFVLLQLMYLGFYVGALANLQEIDSLLSALTHAQVLLSGLVIGAVLLIPVRVFLISAVLFRAPHFSARFLLLWPFLLVADVLWSLAPFLLLHHITPGVALACMAPLVYAPFAERSLVLMGAGGSHNAT